MNLRSRLFGKNRKKEEPDLADQTSESESESDSLHSESSLVKTPASQIPEPDKRSIRVFVSSTFRDMMEERDILMTHTWPELRRFCHKRHVEFVEVDLRWGIAEEQSTRKETLKLCLDEIRACRPFFIGLLGERYGWIPGDEAFTADLQEEQPWLIDQYGKSVTELEIMYGVLKNPEMAGRAFFYFRDPEYAQSRGADFLPENEASAKKQSTLKNLIRTICKEKSIPLHEMYSDPGTLGSLVLDQLKAAIDAQYPLVEIPDQWRREARNQEAFAEIHRRSYIGRYEYFEALDQHAIGEGPPLIILGDPGSGKSALLANWIDHWQKIHPEDFIFQHYIGSTADSAVYWMIIFRLMVEIKRWLGDPKELPHSEDDIRKDFPLWLSKARINAFKAGIRFIVVLDGLTHLEEKRQGKLLSWLPEHQFSRTLRLIVSNLPEDILEATEKRKWDTLLVHPLSIEARHKMIVHYLSRFGKKLDKLRLQQLANTAAASNPLYLKILLDELRVTGTHDRLDERLKNYLAAEDIPGLLGKVLTRYQLDYQHEREGLVNEALGLIWASRRGLTESELLQLLRPDNLPQLPIAFWTPLHAALEESLVNRSGILNFSHKYLNAAVENTFLSSPETKNHFIITLADFFESQDPSLRSSDELPWLLLKAKLHDRLRSCLLNIDQFLYIIARDEEELIGYWVFLKEEISMGKPYLDSFYLWYSKNRSNLQLTSSAAIRLGKFLHRAGLYVESESLYQTALEISEKSFEGNKWAEATSLNNLAGLYKDINRLDKALPLMERALKIEEERFGKIHPKVALSLNNLAEIYKETNKVNESELLYRRAIEINEVSLGKDNPVVASFLSNLALLLADTKRQDEAELLLKRALKIKEEYFGQDHPDVALALNNLAELYRKTDRLSEAEMLFRKALSINEKCLGENHPLVANFLNNLALLLKEDNRFEEAESLYKRALEIYNDRYSGSHQLLASCQRNLALLYKATNRQNEAELLYRKAIKIYEESEEKHRHDLSVCLSELALILQDTNHLGEAEFLLKRALKICKETLGKDHPDVAESLNNIGVLLQTTNRLTEAEPLITRALEIGKKNFGENNIKILPSLVNLAGLHFKNGHFDDAELLFRKMIMILINNSRATGHLHPDLKVTLNYFGGILEAKGWNRDQIVNEFRKMAPELFK